MAYKMSAREREWKEQADMRARERSTDSMACDSSLASPGYHTHLGSLILVAVNPSLGGARTWWRRWLQYAARHRCSLPTVPVT